MEPLLTGYAISKSTGISNRMLRYYEQAGLIQSQRREGYAYRVYDESALFRIRQIIILRKLRIPIKQIGEIFKSNEAVKAIGVFEESIKELDDEMTALSTIRSILSRLAADLKEKANIRLRLDWLENNAAVSMADIRALPNESVANGNPSYSMSIAENAGLKPERTRMPEEESAEHSGALLSRTRMPDNESAEHSGALLQEEKSMDDLNQANEQLNRLTDRDVRIVYLPPATVVSVRCVGGEPETKSGNMLFDFIKRSKLPEVKPGFRHYGFNAPDGGNGVEHGYERWVTIPEDMEVPEGFTKKQFSGGLYAAHMIPMGAFEEWEWLYEWANSHEKYEIVWGDPECMNGFLEEHLDAFHHYLWTPEECDRRLQLDLLIPIRERSK